MRDGNTAEGWRSDRARNAGDHLERDVCLSERKAFFTAASKYERIASFQANHAPASSGPVDKYAINGLLGHGMLPGRFSGIDAFGVHSDEIQKVGVDESIEYHYLGMAEKAESACGDQIGISGPRAYKIDGSMFRSVVHGSGIFRRSGQVLRCRSVRSSCRIVLQPACLFETHKKQA